MAVYSMIVNFILRSSTITLALTLFQVLTSAEYGQASQSDPKTSSPTSVQVSPGTIAAGSTTEVTLSGAGAVALSAKLKDLGKLAVYKNPLTGKPTKIETIKIAPPSTPGKGGEIRLALNVPPDTETGDFELYSGSDPTGATFHVAATPATSQTQPQQVAPKSPVTKPSPEDKTIHVDPSMSAPGQVINIKLSGGGVQELLKDSDPTHYRFYWKLSQTKTDCIVDLPVTKIDSDGTGVIIQLSIAPEAMSGTYQLYKDGASKDGVCGGKSPVDVNFAVGPSALGEYTYCPMTPFELTGVDLLCSQSLLTYKEEREVFGKAVADAYVAIEIKIQNRNSQFQFLLSDVRIGKSTAELTTSRDRTFVRTFSEKGEAFSVRAIAFRAFEAASAILGGIGPVVGNTFLSNTIQILQGPTGSAAHGLFPDRSMHEMEFISDNGFSVVQATVIPAKSPVRVFCFIPQRMILDEKLSKFSDDNSPWPTGDKNSKVPSKFQELQRSLFIEIAGMHVTQVKTGPSVTQIFPDHVQNDVKTLNVSLSGANFDQIRYIQIGDDKASRAPVDPVPGNMNSATATIDVGAIVQTIVKAKGTFSETTLPVYLINTLGQSTDSSTHLTINAAPQKTTPATDTSTPGQNPAAPPTSSADKGNAVDQPAVTKNKAPAKPKKNSPPQN